MLLIQKKKGQQNPWVKVTSNNKKDVCIMSESNGRDMWRNFMLLLSFSGLSLLKMAPLTLTQG